MNDKNLKVDTPSSGLSAFGLLVIFIFSLFFCYDYLLRISISVFLPEIKVSFGLSYFQLGLIGSVFFVSYNAMQVPGGYLLDKFNPWRVALIMSILCAVGSLIMFFSADSYLSLLFSRVLIGIGSSIAFLCAVKIIALFSPLRLFSVFIGILQSLAGVGAIIGQAPIAALNLQYSWNHIALIFFYISIGFLLFFFILMKNKKNIKWNEISTKRPRLTWHSVLSLLKDKELQKIALLSTIAWSHVASLAGFWLVQYLHDVDKLSLVKAGSLITFFWVGLIAGSLLLPLISEWIQQRKPVLIAGFLLQFSGVLLIILEPDRMSWLTFSLFSLGFMSPIQGLCIVLVSDQQLAQGFGVANGIINMFAGLGGGVIQFAIGFMLTYAFSGMANPYFWVFCPYLAISLLGLYISAVKLKESHPARVKKSFIEVV